MIARQEDVDRLAAQVAALQKQVQAQRVFGGPNVLVKTSPVGTVLTATMPKQIRTAGAKLTDTDGTKALDERTDTYNSTTDAPLGVSYTVVEAVVWDNEGSEEWGEWRRVITWTIENGQPVLDISAATYHTISETTEC